MTIRWSASATATLLNLPRADAEAVDRAVQRWAATGAGLVAHVEGEFRLFVGAHYAAFFLDGDTIHVERVCRA